MVRPDTTHREAVMIYRHAIFPALKAGGWMQNRVSGWMHNKPYKRDDEYAHTLALMGIRAMQRVPGLVELLQFATEVKSASKPRDVFGIRFPAPIGLAAGLDKEGVGLPFWQACGLGFAEVGTVLPRKQEGNPRPRIFRLDREKMLINRLGFNSPGMGAVRSNILRARQRVRIPIGGSLGAMKETLAEKPESAKFEYLAVAKELLGVVDFYVVNVSSPNTPGLRDLQGLAYIEDLLRTVIKGVAGYATQLAQTAPPLLVKVAPDLTLLELEDVIVAVMASGADGLVIGNTTILRPTPIPQPLEGVYAEKGGASGGDWLFDKTLALGKHSRRVAPKLPLVLVGGIDSAEKAARALEVADLIEVLTAFVYQGPALVHAIRRVRVPEPAFLLARRAAA